ncbi:MAG: TRAP transporter small permease [Alphaproteobacteria bacterium]
MHRALERFCTFLNYFAAAWLMLIAVVIFVEVTSRGVFNTFLGGDEIVTNSVPAIVFLQIPLAILTGSMLRTTITFDHLNKKWRHIVNAVAYLLGMLLFIGIAVGGWTDMIKGWEIGEYQGIGALEVPVYPIRTIIIASAILVTFLYFVLLVRAATGNDTTPGAQATESGGTEEL